MSKPKPKTRRRSGTVRLLLADLEARRRHALDNLKRAMEELTEARAYVGEIESAIAALRAA